MSYRNYLILTGLYFFGFFVGIMFLLYDIQQEKNTYEKNIISLQQELNTIKTIHDQSIIITVNDDISQIASFIMHKRHNRPKILAEIIAMEIWKQSFENNIDSSLILSIMWVESMFNPFSKSSKDAKGLMQILDTECGGKIIDQERIYEIDYNIECGICIFKEKLKISNNDVNVALYKYVGGCEEYVKKVLDTVEEYNTFIKQN